MGAPLVVSARRPSRRQGRGLDLPPAKGAEAVRLGDASTPSPGDENIITCFVGWAVGWAAPTALSTVAHVVADGRRKVKSEQRPVMG